MSHTFTPESTKRILSSSSSPNPNPRVKTLKTFVSPNRFAALTSDEDLPEVFSPPSISAASESQREPTAPVSKHLDDNAAEDFNKPSPPMVINNITDYSALKANLISLLGTDGFTVTVKGTSIHVKTRNCTDHYKLIDYCNDQDLEAHTWAPRHSRPIKVFIRHLHHTIAVEDIEKVLTDEGFSVINDNNITAFTSLGLILLVVLFGSAAVCALIILLFILYTGLTMTVLIADVVRSPKVQFTMEKCFPGAVQKINRGLVSQYSSVILDFGRRAIATLVVGTWGAVQAIWATPKYACLGINQKRGENAHVYSGNQIYIWI
ncbi:hypothetical protein QTP88_023668 [Uroleucon formosanum]